MRPQSTHSGRDPKHVTVKCADSTGVKCTTGRCSSAMARAFMCSTPARVGSSHVASRGTSSSGTHRASSAAMSCAVARPLRMRPSMRSHCSSVACRTDCSSTCTSKCTASHTAVVHTGGGGASYPRCTTGNCRKSPHATTTTPPMGSFTCRAARSMASITVNTRSVSMDTSSMMSTCKPCSLCRRRWNMVARLTYSSTSLSPMPNAKKECTVTPLSATAATPVVATTCASTLHALVRCAFSVRITCDLPVPPHPVSSTLRPASTASTARRCPGSNSAASARDSGSSACPNRDTPVCACRLRTCFTRPYSCLPRARAADTLRCAPSPAPRAVGSRARFMLLCARIPVRCRPLSVCCV